MKEFKLGLVLGRFQIFHKGHELIIDKALEKCEKVLIFIGSSDKSNTFSNPFNYFFRSSVIKNVYDNKNLFIAPLPDLGVGDVPAWGKYVIDSAKEIIGMPDCIIYGKEEKCEKWYKDYKDLKFIKVNRSKINISSTKLKELIIDGNYEEYKKYVNEKITSYYDFIREKLIELKDKTTD